MHDYALILQHILRDYALPVNGYHGVVHWARVLENGLLVAEENGADAEVVRLFALFHDSCRVNEHRDYGHGTRGGNLARSLRGTLVHLSDARFDLLYDACALHTDGLTTGDATLLACWDADRLDLGRVGITPKPELLCTDAARALLSWADARATRDHVPTEVLTQWGMTPALTPVLTSVLTPRRDS
ncbi:hypothetical protein [Gemmatimonas groenlandica]|uniref:HD domain-containing protein n=1 Tax=Gemmatimonas groenlandica TaxID=2732249 RepID=A0A6M4IPF4_9BACT|nr:hypothetical protein [Gemmatimonas groenlandica]QJR35828.1 hypothetical protein HKW67_10055 [Gemmatimonas groenlandica]